MQRAKNTAIGKTQWMVCGAAFLGWLFDGFEMGLFPIVARPALMDMYPGQGEVDAYVGQWMGWITAVFLLGAAALAKRYRRLQSRRPLLFGISLSGA